MSNCNIHVDVMDNQCPIALQVDTTTEISFGVGEQSIVVENDYDGLRNKPRINGVELIGNKLIADLFPDGIVIDGGTAEGVG